MLQLLLDSCKKAMYIRGKRETEIREIVPSYNGDEPLDP